MSANTHSPKTVIAAVVICGALIAFVLTTATGVIGLGGVVMAAGYWKGTVDQRMDRQENSTKEQISALTSNTAKQIEAVAAASKTMVEGLEKTTDKRLSDIERDRTEKIAEATRWRADQGATVSRLDTLITGQQKQIDTLTDIATRPRSTRP